MKKVNQTNRLLHTMLTASAICALSVSAPAFAAGEAGLPAGGLIPNGPGYNAKGVRNYA